MVKELLRTIPHALSGHSKFGRTLMYMSPVASSTIERSTCCFCHPDRSGGILRFSYNILFTERIEELCWRMHVMY